MARNALHESIHRSTTSYELAARGLVGAYSNETKNDQIWTDFLDQMKIIGRTRGFAADPRADTRDRNQVAMMHAVNEVMQIATRAAGDVPRQHKAWADAKIGQMQTEQARLKKLTGG